MENDSVRRAVHCGSHRPPPPLPGSRLSPKRCSRTVHFDLVGTKAPLIGEAMGVRETFVGFAVSEAQRLEQRLLPDAVLSFPV